MKSKFSIIVNSVLGLFFPETCNGCGRPLLMEEKYICTDCIFDLPYTYFKDTENNVLFELFMGRIPTLFKAYALCYFVKKSQLQKLLHNLKYSKKPEVGKELGIYLGNEMEKLKFDDIDIIIPVPLHYKRLKVRGYNQSEMIALGIKEVIKNAEVDTKTVIRAVHTKTQTKKGKIERWDNVKDIFEIKNPEKLENKHILIVDDVITTGSTIESLARTIETVKNVKISLACVAVARKI